jgi:hypothetical protein
MVHVLPFGKMARMRYRLWLSWLLLCGLCSCARCDESDKAGAERGKVLVKVGDSEITTLDLAQSIERSFGEYGRSVLDEQARRKVLESLAMSRAIALASEGELDAQQRAALDRKVAAYREELLVKQYLAKHAPPEPVTDADVERYYKDHPEHFGGKKQREYELIASERVLNPAERDALLKVLTNPAQKVDWQSFVAELRAKGHPVTYQRGQGSDQALHARLRSTLESLAQGQASPLLFIEGRTYVVRLTGIQELPPRPLSEVSAQIRSALTPVQLKDSLERVGGDVLKQTRVEYLD